ncbi:MAG TPA: serine/threonine-protein kinase, partial [Gemmatimonadales bacterium]|nr:serine/threonine-protein kinase [Gemmatimonadales bacterium]
MTDPALSPEFLALQAALAGSYSLVRELGRGGMGVVFLAREVALDRLVAIKMLPLALGHDATLRERFLREARTAAQLAHPHIVPIHAVGSADALVWFVMEYVPGASLGERLRREGALPTTDALRIVQETAWALAHAHARGVIHRDVKPDNILLQDDSDRVLVTDFGIAHGGDTTDGAKGFGTLHYMSPEQAHGEAADARADIYALGVTAWHALAGHRPFEGQQGAALLATQSRADAPSIRTAVPTLPSNVAHAIDRAIARDPDARWTTMEEFARALDSARALAPRLPVPLRRFAREAVEHSDRLGMALGVSAGAFLGAGLVDIFFATFLGIESAIYLLIGTVTTAMALALLGGHVAKLRELAALGYTRPQALRAIADLEAEEPTRIGRSRLPFWNAVPGVIAGAAGVMVAGMALMTDGEFFTAVPGLLATVLAPAVAIRRVAALRGTRGKWWTRFLTSTWGSKAWRLFTLGVAKAPPVEVAGEPTALALG